MDLISSLGRTCVINMQLLRMLRIVCWVATPAALADCCELHWQL